MDSGGLLALGIVVSVFAALGVVFAIVITVKRRQRAELVAEIQRAGERILGGPGWARKREGLVSVAGALIVTDRRVVFVGGFRRTSIPFADVTNVRLDKTFNNSYMGGMEWVVLSHRGSEREVGFVTQIPALAEAVGRHRQLA
jgi:hypothetical protein